MKNTFVKSALLLSVTALLVKIIGAAYRIPLSSMLGAGQMGVYTTAFHIYALVSSLSTAGIPIASAQLCAARLAVGDTQGAKNVYKVSRRILVLLGIVFFLFMAIFAQNIAVVMHCEDAAPAIRAASPAVLLGSWMAARRARFQGMQNMGAIAASQLAEQVVRLGAGLALASIFSPMGHGMGAAGAMLGTTLSELAGCIVLRVLGDSVRDGRYDAKLCSVVLQLAMPLTLGACILPLSSVLENLMLAPRMALLGKNASQALSDYGILTGMVQSISTLPVMLTGTLSACLMPNIAAAAARPEICRYRARQGETLAFVFSIAMGTGLFLTAESVLDLLYPTLQGEDLVLAANLLKINAVSAIPHCCAIAAMGALQGLGKTKACAAAQICCAFLKLPIAFFLLPKVGVAGYSIASLLGAMLSCIITTVTLRRTCRGTLLTFHTVFTCFCAALLMICAILLLQRMMGYDTLSLCFVIIIAVAVYLLGCMSIFKEEKLWERSPSLRWARANREN